MTGGTGVTGHDVTPEAFRQLYELEDPEPRHRRSGRRHLSLRPAGSPGACRDGWQDLLKRQLDSRFRPCSLVEPMPRLQEQLTTGG